MSAGTPRKLSAIDVLSAGYRELNRRPLLIVPLLVANSLLAFTPPVSLRPLFTWLSEIFDRAVAAQGLDEQGSGAQLLELANLDWRLPFAFANALPLLNLGTVVEVQTPAFAIGGWEIILAFLAVNLVGFSLSVLFLAAAGRAVRGEGQPNGLLRDLGRVALMYGAWLAIVGFLAVVLGTPLLFVASVIFTFVPPLGVLALIAGMFVVFWVSIYFGFTREAIAVERMDVIAALRASFGIMRQHFWGAVVFLLLTSFLVPAGTTALWQMLPQSLIGLSAAVIGSSYIGTGLAVARIVFVHDRLGKRIEQ